MTARGIFIVLRPLEASLLIAGPPPYRFEFVAVVGASGVGKTAIAEYVRKELGLSRIPSCTSRAPRAEDAEGYYQYLSLEDFLARKKRGEFLEAAQYGRNWYGRLCRDMETLNRELAIGDATEEGILTFRAEHVAVYAVQIVAIRNDKDLTDYMRERATEDAQRVVDGLYQATVVSDHTTSNGLAAARSQFAEIVRDRLAAAYRP